MIQPVNTDCCTDAGARGRCSPFPARLLPPAGRAPSRRLSLDIFRRNQYNSRVRALPQESVAKHRTPTLEEVARMAGVSRATASRVFTDSPRVSEEARRSVQRAAGELGYVPNRAARSLVTGRSD